MKQFRSLLPIFLGLIGAVLRFVQCRTVFEPDTMLARPHIISVILPLYLLLCAVFFLLTGGKGSKEKQGFDDVFAVPEGTMLMGFVCSAMLLMAAGGYMAVSHLPGRAILPMVLGAAAVIAGACLFLAIQRLRREESAGGFLLMPVFFAVIWLLVVYQDYASWPVTTVYYVQVLAIAAAALAFYHAAACACGQGREKWCALFLPMAVVLCLTALADAAALYTKGLYLACLGAAFGFWLCMKHNNKA